MKVWLVICLLYTQSNLGLIQNRNGDFITNLFINRSGSPPEIPETPQVCGPNQRCDLGRNFLNGSFNANRENLNSVRSRRETQCDCCNRKGARPSPVPPTGGENPPFGTRNKDGVGSNRGGRRGEAKFGEFPWMVAIFYEDSTDDVMVTSITCGGSLVAENVVLTSALCVKGGDPNDLVVRAGEWNIKKRNEAIPHQDRRVKEVITHEKFDKDDEFDNVALIIVDAPFEYKETVRPICLRNRNQYFDFERCYATGWGKVKCVDNGIYPAIMKKLEMTIVSKPVCKEIHKDDDHETKMLDLSHICVRGVEGQKMCNEDGGGPLVCLIDEKADQYVQVGIYSMASLTSDKVPDLHTDVAHMRPWIDSKLRSRNIDIPECSPQVV